MLLCHVSRNHQVGVTCNFNDVHNSRVEVRPDRAYLKQQLKAVEARVMAIQEKKRKLDQRMSVLTDGLKVGVVQGGGWGETGGWKGGSVFCGVFATRADTANMQAGPAHDCAHTRFRGKGISILV